jgi:hypothetical protein
MIQSSDSRLDKVTFMSERIRIVTVERDGDDGVILTLSDGTTAAYVVEELLELRPRREPIETQTRRNAALTSGNAVDGKTESSASPGRIEWREALLRLQTSG